MGGFWRPRLCLLLVFCLGVLAACGGRPAQQDYFEEANRRFDQGEFEAAVKVLGEYLHEYPFGERRDYALFRSGRILFFALGQKGRALQQFSRLVEDYPQSAYSREAREILAAIFRDESQDYARAIVEYRWLLSQGPPQAKAAEYEYQVAHCYFLADDLPEAERQLTAFVRRYEPAALEGEAGTQVRDLVVRGLDELGSALMIQGRQDEALKVFARLLAQFPQHQLRPTVEFKIGNCFEELGLLDQALAQYRRVDEMVENWPAVKIRIQGVETRLLKKRGAGH